MSRSLGRLADPHWRHERAQKAARARTGPDHHIAKLADVADDLTDEQARKIVTVLNLWASRAVELPDGDAA